MLKEIIKDRTEQVLDLIDKENLNVTDKKTGNTLLQIALENMNLTIIRELVKRVDINQRNIKDGSTALMTAVNLNFHDGIQILLQNKADCEILYNGKNILFYAALLCDEKVLKLFLQYKVQVPYGNFLHQLLDENKLENAMILIQHNCDITGLDDNGDTIFHVAAGHGYGQIIQTVLQSQTYNLERPLINLKNKEGNTPLHVAAMNERQVFINLLLEHKQELGLDYNCKNKAGFTYYEILDNIKKAKELAEQEKSVRKRLIQQDKVERKEQRKNEVKQQIKQEEENEKQKKIEFETRDQRLKEQENKSRFFAVVFLITLFAFIYIFFQVVAPDKQGKKK